MEPDKSFHSLRILGAESENAGSSAFCVELTSNPNRGEASAE